MPFTQPAATTHPQGRRGAISVPQGQDLADYMMQQQQQSQAQAQARLHATTPCEAKAQPEQQAVAGAEAPKEYRA
jgi:hypothetical protein